MLPVPDASVPAVEICGWDELLSQRDTVVGQKDALETVSDDRIIVDGACHIVEQLYDQLGHMISWRSLEIIHKHDRIDKNIIRF